MSYLHYLDIALEAARAAEKVIRHYYQNDFDIDIKEDMSPVTIADIETEKVIRKIILSAFPDHGFFGEETGKTNESAEYLWLIDPIDGTKSFVREYPFFSTQIALMHKGEIVVGVSNGVMFNELAYASRGSGAFMNEVQLGVSAITELSEASLSTGNIASLAANTESWSQCGELMQKVNRTRGYGDFYHYHLLASGKVDVIVESDLNILDIAALSIIVEEAGGRFSELSGGKINLDTRSVLATATEKLHTTVKESLSYRETH